MPVPLNYMARNLWARRLTTALTASGLALVIFVFATVLMLDAGLKRTLVTTGEFDNLVAIRKGSETEIQSGIYRDQASIIEMNPAIALGPEGRPLVSKESVVLISLNKRGTDQPSNVVIRGTSSAGLQLRPQVRLTAGRLFNGGATEIIVGSSIASGYGNTRIGDRLRFAQREWVVVGQFDAGGSGFDSEIWGDVDQLMQAFRRPVYSSVLFRLRDSSEFAALKEQIESDPRLSLEAKRETRYYYDQSESMAKFLRILGLSLTIIFSLGAVIGAMITMYAAVANRVNEIGTLRALGFRRKSILWAFLLESLLLGFFGGAFGLFFSSFLQLFTISTMNFQTFSELAFSFTLSLPIAAQAMGFALIMGFAGGLLPAIRAARMNIVDALRAA